MRALLRASSIGLFSAFRRFHVCIRATTEFCYVTDLWRCVAFVRARQRREWANQTNNYYRNYHLASLYKVRRYEGQGASVIVRLRVKALYSVAWPCSIGHWELPFSRRFRLAIIQPWMFSSVFLLVFSSTFFSFVFSSFSSSPRDWRRSCNCGIRRKKSVYPIDRMPFHRALCRS